MVVDRDVDVRPIEVAELLDAAYRQLDAAWSGGSKSQSMALVIGTLAAHGRMLRYVETVESKGEVDPVMLARLRWSLDGHVDAIKASTRSTAVAIGRCHVYLKAARVELQRLTEAVIESQWTRRGQAPGPWSRREATAP